MLSFSIKGMQINRAYIFLINWKTYIINDYSKWTNDSTDKMTDHVSKVCLPQLFKIILKHPKRTGNYCILSSLWHIYQPFYFWNKRCEMPQKNTTQIVIKKYSYHDRSIVKYLGILEVRVLQRKPWLIISLTSAMLLKENCSLT